MTTIQDIKDIANEIVVNRLTINHCEKQMQDIIDAHPELKALQATMDQARNDRDVAQKKMIELMSKNDLLSYKTENANFARAKRASVTVDPLYKKEIEREMKSGKMVEGWHLSEREYISVRLNPKK